MGMFDWIQVACPLPDQKIWSNPRALQTKSLDCTMDLYRIDEDGRLHRRHVFMEYSKPEPAPDDYQGKRKWLWEITQHTPREIGHEWRPHDFSGEINFYGEYPKVSFLMEYDWRTYRAWFRKGQLRDVFVQEFPYI